MSADLNEEMFTDYAMQILTAYMTEDETIIESLMQSYSDKEWNNPAFMPGVMFGLIVHFQMIMKSISEMTGHSVEDVFAEYARAYALSRETMMDKFISPSRAAEIISDWLNKESEKN